jgi:hypothetical protein
MFATNLQILAQICKEVCGFTHVSVTDIFIPSPQSHSACYSLTLKINSVAEDSAESAPIAESSLWKDLTLEDSDRE